MNNRTLSDFVDRHPRLFVLTGAGCSTESGLPDYRDACGSWKQAQPMSFQSFMADPGARRRYWSRSLVGWRRFRQAVPNDAHRALARLENRGQVELLVTQNVDRLHQAAGSRETLDLHGRLDLVRCMHCDRRSRRDVLQDELLRRNPDWNPIDAPVAPDGDADLGDLDLSRFDVPACEACGGLLKPDVVFFGEGVPRPRVAAAMAAVDRADAMLIVGSSLMVLSGFRFARAMAQAGKPIAAVNLGRTRADPLLTLKLTERCTQGLSFLLDVPGFSVESDPY